jgi:hypothetical protein
MSDPVTAITEAEATGETAAIFADIRATLEVPVVNLIWRHLATIDGGLAWAWAAAKPIYTTGAAEAAGDRLRETLKLPMPELPAPGAFRSIGMDAEAVETARAVVAAYDRGNTLNLMALTALAVDPSGAAPASPTPGSPSAKPHAAASPAKAFPLPRILSEPDVSAETWATVKALNTYGARPDEPIMATLYRHLAHWPGLLALIHTGLEPLEHSGAIRASIRAARDHAREEGAGLAAISPVTAVRHEAAAAAITEFADHVICRMVPIGMAIARWIDQSRDRDAKNRAS